MNQTPTELLAPYKAALVAAARDLRRAAGPGGIAFEIPGTAPQCLIVIGEEADIGTLLRTPVREPMVGGRRAGDPPAALLTFDEPDPVLGAPRKWSILLTSEGHGLVGRLGHRFEHAQKQHERVDVVELEPIVRELGMALQENARLGDAVQQLRGLVADVQRDFGQQAEAAARERKED